MLDVAYSLGTNSLKKSNPTDFSVLVEYMFYVVGNIVLYAIKLKYSFMSKLVVLYTSQVHLKSVKLWQSLSIS